MSNAMQELMSLKVKLGKEVEEFKRRYDRARTDYDAVVRSLELLEMRITAIPQVQEPDISARDIDFTGTKNLRERLERIARKNNGLVNTTKAAVLLIEAKQSNSKKHNIRSVIHRILNEDADTWKKIGPGTYRHYLWSVENATDDGMSPDMIIQLMPESREENGGASSESK